MAESLSTRVKASVERKVGGKAVKSKKGTGCFALIYEVLKAEGAKTAFDYGQVTNQANHAWGESVDLESIQPGDILQFRDHLVTIEVQELGATSWRTVDTKTLKRGPQHTAVVLEVLKDGGVVVGEQHVGKDTNRVVRNTIPRLAPGEADTKYEGNSRKVIVTVTGSVWAYRPVPSSKGATLFRLDERPAGSRRVFADYLPSDGGLKRRPGPFGTA